MKPLLLTLILATLCATGYGQTLKSVMYNTTNNTVVGLSNAQRLNFEHIGLTAGTATAPSLTYASGTNSFGTFSSTAIGVGPFLGFSVDGTRRFFISTNTIRAELPISFSAGSDSATRTNLAAAAAPIWAYKATNQTNATTNLVSDTALTFTAAANTKYAVELFLIVEQASGLLDAKIETSGGVAVIGHFLYHKYDDGLIYGAGVSVTNRSLVLTPDELPISVSQRFVISVGTNSGSATFQFAANQTNGPAVIAAGSYLKAEVIE